MERDAIITAMVLCRSDWNAAVADKQFGPVNDTYHHCSTRLCTMARYKLID